MNKLITTNNGGFPFTLDDLRWLENGLTDALKGIVNHVSSTEVLILSGCEYNEQQLSDTDQLVMTAGYVYFNGEIYKVDAVNATLSSGNTFYWDLKVTNDPAGNLTFEDTNTYDVYQIREFEVKQAASVPAGKVEVTDEKTIFSVFRDKLRSSSSFDSPMNSYNPGYSDVLLSPFSYCLSSDNIVHLTGRINGTGLLSSNNIGVIKNEIKPSNNVLLVAHIYNPNSNKLVGYGRLEILNTGAVWFYPDVVSGNSVDDHLIISTSYFLM